jgi:hypothetical protein
LAGEVVHLIILNHTQKTKNIKTAGIKIVIINGNFLSSDFFIKNPIDQKIAIVITRLSKKYIY